MHRGFTVVKRDTSILMISTHYGMYGVVEFSTVEDPGGAHAVVGVVVLAIS